MNRRLRTFLRKATAIVAMAAVASGPANAGLLISQYVETDSGTTPKGIEIWTRPSRRTSTAGMARCQQGSR